MKIGSATIQPLRSFTAIPFKGIKPHLRRQIKAYNRSNSRFTRVQPATPFFNLGLSPSPSSPRKRKPLTTETFVKQYERFDRFTPLEETYDGVSLKLLSDIIDPGWGHEVDLDAIQERNEEQWPSCEQEHVRLQLPVYYGVEIEVDDEDTPMGDGSTPDPKDVEMTKPLEMPRIECPGGWDGPYMLFQWYGTGAFKSLGQKLFCERLPPVQRLTTKMVDVPFPFPPSPFSPASLPLGADPFQQPVVNEPVVEAAASLAQPSAMPSVAANDGVRLVDLDDVPREYHGFLQEAMTFSRQQQKAWPDHFKSGDQKPTIRSMKDYPGWPSHLKVTPQVYCPNPNDSEEPISRRLGAKRNKELRKRYSNLWKHNPEVWEALLGSLLQEGVSIDNLLLCHDAKSQVLQNQKWCIDNLRFDNLQWHTFKDAPLPSDCSTEFYKAPEGKGKLLLEELMYLRNQPEICYVFRILVSEWLKVEANQETFRNIAQKAGWCPRSEHRLQRQFVDYIFGDPESIDKNLYDLVNQHFPIRYARFFQATIQEEEIEYPRMR